MKKRVKTKSLRLGMIICEFDRQWQDSPSAKQGFVIKSTDQIKLISTHCDYVYIKSDPQTPGPVHPGSADIMSYEPSHFDRPELELEMLKKYAAPGATRGGYPDRISAEDEIEAVRTIYEQAVNLIDNILIEVRHGKNIKTAATRKLVADLTDSVLRNPDALVCFTKLTTRHAGTAQHGLRCCILALVIGRHLRMGQQQLYDLGIGALLHDIGKTRLPVEILDCGHELNDKEKQSYFQHIADGVAILENTPGISSIAIDVARYHHERYDGAGFMLGLRGNEISQFGHIGNIVNYYDEMTNDRPGHKKISAHLALKMIYEQRGKTFHPHLVEEFIRCMGIYPIGSIVEMLSGEVGVVVALNRSRIFKPRVAIVLDPACNTVNDPVIVDLVEYRNQRGEVLEITKVLEEKAYNFDPVDYLPVFA